METSLGIEIEQPQQQNHHQQQTLIQTQQHPHNNINNNNNIDITNNTTGVGIGDHLGGSNVILSNHERINANYPNPIKRPPQPHREPTPANKVSINTAAPSKSNKSQQNQPAPSNPSPQKILAKANITAKINNTNATKEFPLCEDDVRRTLATGDVDSFFARGLHNSYQATEELIRGIEESQDESLAREVLNRYQSHYSTLERPWDHETFMYGLGLIYMRFNAYNWAIKSLRDTVYVRPGFPKSRDIHTRLGLIFKSTGQYRLSAKHFNLAIHDTRKDSGTSTNLELRFHLAHLSELQGETKQAIELYEKLLQEKDLPDKLSANIHRNLGWIHYSTVSTCSESINRANNNHDPKASRRPHDNIFGHSSLIEPQKLDASLNHLNTSNRTESDSRTSYYLGRCLTSLGKFQDAFAFYRSVIDKEESTADTWCSIGVLYQRQNQPWDALQAYIRSVQYDKKHAVAWKNLGILYETHHQFKDALKCYRHVLRSNSASMTDIALQTRINYIHKHLSDIEASTSNSGKPDVSTDKLLSLEDLWNMESKTNQESYISSTSNIIRENSSAHKPKEAAPAQTKSALKSHPSGQRHRAQNNMTTPMEIDHPRLCNGQNVDQTKQSTTTPTTTHRVNSESTDSKGQHHQEAANNDPIKFQTNQINPDDMKLPMKQTNGSQTKSDDHKSPVASQINQDLKPLQLEPREPCLNQLFTNGASKDSGISSDSSTYADCALVPSQSTDINTACYLSAERILETCNEISTTKLKKIDVILMSDENKHPSSCLKPPIYPPLRPTGALLPLPPSILLDSKKELSSKRMQDICFTNPISIVRNMANVLKLDLGLFSTRTLVESNPDQPIDIIGHLFSQDSESETTKGDECMNPWLCERHLSRSTISRYASYQASSFRQSLKDERESKTKSQPNKESETDSNESATNKKSNSDGPGPSKQTETSMPNFKSSPATKTKSKKDCSPTKYVKSANMIDLSDEKIWRPQIHELNKLPHFLKCVSASNMLTHIGSAVPGLNTITMSMHVPGCKIIDNRMPSHFCSVHINTGPGDYEWCAISTEYESVLRKLCNRNGLDLDRKGWWPLLSDLQKYRIPIYRFTQRPGDMVWVNSGTLFWVQSTGWANNIQWNLGPLCARQYQIAADGNELDKFLFRRPEAPLVQMTWNIIMNISIITDDELFWSMANILRRSLRFCKYVRDLIKESEANSIIQSNEDFGPRAAKFCTLCETEVFNITFELTQQDDKKINCVECARRADCNFTNIKIMQEYDLKHLMKLYDEFIDMKKKYQVKQMQMRRKHRA